MSRSRIIRKLRVPALAVGAAATCFTVIAATCGSARAASGISDIGYGSRGPGVVCVQQGMDYLAAHGVIPVDTAPAVDGVFGPKTKLAVMVFQDVNYYWGTHEPIDGIVGPTTGELLLDDEFSNGQAAWVEACFPYIPTPPGTTFT